MAQTNVTLKKPLERCVFEVTVNITKEFRFRLWLGKHLLFWAARVLGAAIEFKPPSSTPPSGDVKIDGVLVSTCATDSILRQTSRAMEGNAGCLVCGEQRVPLSQFCEIHIDYANKAFREIQLKGVMDPAEAERFVAAGKHYDTHRPASGGFTTQGSSAWPILEDACKPVSSEPSYQHVMDPLEADSKRGVTSVALRFTEKGQKFTGKLSAKIIEAQSLDSKLDAEITEAEEDARKLAIGGFITSSKPYLVGEQSPELVVPAGYAKHTVSFCVLCGGIYHTQAEADELNIQVANNIKAQSLANKLDVIEQFDADLERYEQGKSSEPPNTPR